MTGGLLACCFSASSPSRRLVNAQSATAGGRARNHRQWSFDSPRHPRLQPFLIRSRGRRMPDRMNGCAQRGARARVRDVGQAIVHPQTIPPSTDQSGTSKVHEVPRDGRLRQPKRLVEVSDAHFAVRQDTQNP